MQPKFLWLPNFHIEDNYVELVNGTNSSKEITNFRKQSIKFDLEEIEGCIQMKGQKIDHKIQRDFLMGICIADYERGTF